MNYPNIASLINQEAAEQKERTAAYILNGWEGDADAGLKRHSTETRWNQYKRGEIAREKAVELATARANKDQDKRTAAKLNQLASAAEVAEILEIGIVVEWKKSRTWGANPTAEARIYWKDVNGEYRHGLYTGKASGCGYDKRSAAVAEALNKCPAALKILYDMKEAEPNKKNGESCGYGAGYGARPYYEGGVGIDCFIRIAEKYGLETTRNERAKMTDFYNWSRKAETETA